jgi:acetyl esterase/lipase
METERDVIVFFYGGRWEDGTKEDYRFVGTALAKDNFIVVIPNYRKYPAVRFPVFVEDAAKAVAWVGDHIAEHGGSRAHIHVMGHSAGAHIGALVTADKRYLAHENKSAGSVIKSFIGLAGPYDFTPEDKDLIDMFGPAENFPQMQVTSFIDGQEPPMLLLQGKDDATVKLYNLERLEARIREKDGCVESILYPDIDHTWLVGALSWLGSAKAPVQRDIKRFIDKVDRGSFCKK